MTSQINASLKPQAPKKPPLPPQKNLKRSRSPIEERMALIKHEKFEELNNVKTGPAIKEESFDSHPNKPSVSFTNALLTSLNIHKANKKAAQDFAYAYESQIENINCKRSHTFAMAYSISKAYEKQSDEDSTKFAGVFEKQIQEGKSRTYAHGYASAVISGHITFIQYPDSIFYKSVVPHPSERPGDQIASQFASVYEAQILNKKTRAYAYGYAIAKACDQKSEQQIELFATFYEKQIQEKKTSTYATSYASYRVYHSQEDEKAKRSATLFGK
jgi:hypothetical protein